MHRILVTLIILVAGLTSNVAQLQFEELTLIEGEEMIVPSSGQIPRIFGWDETGYYALGLDHRYYLEHFDRNFKSTTENHLILHREWRTRDLESVLYFHGKIYMFSSEQRFRTERDWLC